MVAWTRRLLVVEDDVLLASLLAESLGASGFDVAVASDAREARDRVDDFDPDVVLLDVALGSGPSGVHLAHALQRIRPDIAILMLSQHSDPRNASGAGLDVPPGVGFVRKDQVGSARELIRAIDMVLADKWSDLRQDTPETDNDLALTPRSFSVLGLLAQGLSNAEVARRCDVSAKTAERWIETLYRELGLQTRGPVNPRVEAVRRYYLANGIPTQVST